VCVRVCVCVIQSAVTYNQARQISTGEEEWTNGGEEKILWE